MRRFATGNLLAVPVLLLAQVQAGVAQAQPPQPAIPSWTTTVVPAQPSGPKPKASRAKEARIETGALPAPAAPVPKGSLSRGRHDLEGLASFYWQDQKTASGETFDKMALTAAHRTLPFNTRVRVTHLGNGRSIVVRINDRGPFKAGRVIDLSYAAAGAIGMHGQGLARVKVEVIEEPRAAAAR
jgi:rare lipoprotein A